MKIDRTFSYTSLPPASDPAVAAALQAMAKAIDQLTAQINKLTFGQSLSDVVSGAPAGNFNAKFLSGLYTSAGVQQRFFHNLGRVPIGCIELLTIPPPDRPGGAATNIAAPLAVTALDSEAITITCTSSAKVFTLLVF